MTATRSAIGLWEQQTWFATIAMHPDGMDAGVVAANRMLDLGDSHPVERVVKAGLTLTASERLRIYNDGYFARLIECLADDYPALADALGEPAFSSLARDYIRHNPSTSPNLNAYGRGVSDHCRSLSEPWGAFAAALSRLEWALVDVIHARACPGLAPDALSAIPVERWHAARLVPSAALRVLTFDYPVGEYYQAFLDGLAPGIPEPRSSATAVYRRELTLWRMELGATASRLLQNLVGGVSLGAAISMLEGQADGPSAREELERGLPKWLGDWVSSGFFTAVELG